MIAASLDAVCRLEGEDLDNRLLMIRRELLPRVKSTHELADGLVYEFDASPEMRARLDAFVRVERDSCSTLRWDIRETESALHLHIDGVNARAFRSHLEGAETSGSKSIFRRVTKAAGIGVGGSLVACCVVPLGIALGFGAAVAAPFAFLEDPLWIGLGAIAIAVPAWYFIGRRRAAVPCWPRKCASSS